MASTLVSTLYPPLVDTFMPAFVYTDDYAEVKFSISPYNTKDKIKYLHISVVDQTNNQSVLNPSSISSSSNAALTLSEGVVVDDVYILPFNYEDSASGVYTVKIPRGRLKAIESNSSEEPAFKPGQYYKVQLRFDGTVITNNKQAFSTDYLIENRQYFSEWSSVCLIRPIYCPVLSLNRFSNPKKAVSFNQGIIPIAGKLFFDADNSPFADSEGNLLTDDNERLQSYRFQLLSKNGEVIDDSGVQYPGLGSNSIFCYLNAENAIQGAEYTLKAFVTTKNQYNLEEEYLIKIQDFDNNYSFEPICTIVEDIEDGRIKLTIITTEKTGQNYVGGKLYVKRASSKDNFKTWELLSCTEHESCGRIQETVIDSTVCSMVRYKYSIQFQYVTSAEGVKVGTWSKTYYTEEVFPTFYDMLLSRGNTQLAIRYNGQVSNMKPVVNRTKFDTLGSKYPRFAENALLNYKQYNISGLISAEGDFNRTFLSELDDKYAEDIRAYDKVFGQSYMVRNDTVADGDQPTDASYVAEDRVNSLKNTLHDVYPHNNWYWEREFREEVVQWLNDGEPKLFRSMPEGNMAVMITDVNLTPNQSIGRMLYSFTATMYEVGDGYSLEALDDMKIIDVPNLEEVDILTTEGMLNDFNDNLGIYAQTVNKIYQIELSAGDELSTVRNIVTQELGPTYQGVRENLLPAFEDILISNVKIEFTSLPQYYSSDLESEGKTEDDLLGYVVQYTSETNVDEKKFFISDRGYYQFSPEQKFTDLWLTHGAAIITFTLSYKEGTSAKDTPSESFIQEQTIGQLSGVFEYNEWLAANINNKYEMAIYSIEGETQKLRSRQFLDSIYGLSFDVTPYAIAEILYEEDLAPTSIVIGRTGVYETDRDCKIQNVRFAGRRLISGGRKNSQHLDSWEFRKGNQGERNSVYAITDSDYMITFNGRDYPFYYIDESELVGVAEIPVEGYITYFGDIIRSEYE